jgi:hypothetical protein
MTKEQLERYARVEAEDAVRYHEPPLDEATIINIANHIRDAWLDGERAGKLSV